MIVDCFIFYNEIQILKKRLRYLSKVVDKFVIVESTLTHAGREKKLYYNENKELFREWWDKIIHVIVEDNPTDEDPWKRENHQRSCILRGLENIQKGALVMLSDVDEIPKLELIRLPDNHSTVVVHMYHFEYNFNYHQIHEPWFGTVITTLEIMKEKGPQKLRDTRWNFPVFKFGGWHLSSFGNEEFVENKLKNYTHCFDEKHKNLSIELVKECIKNGIHSDGKHKLQPTSYQMFKELPPEITND